MNQYSCFFAMVHKLGWEESDWRALVLETTGGRCSSLKACNEAEYEQIIAYLTEICPTEKQTQPPRLVAKIYALCYELNFTKAGKKEAVVVDNQKLDEFLQYHTAPKKPLHKQTATELRQSILSLEAYKNYIINHKK